MILGAGVTGLGAAVASQVAVFETEGLPGGTCRSYYARPGRQEMLSDPPEDESAYRFEVGGGHWIFGSDPEVIQFLESCGTLRTYSRKAAVYFPQWDLLAPYPLQYHLHAFDAALTGRVLDEVRRPRAHPAERMSDWIEQAFGRTLTDLFFGPFHEAYTAGLWTRIAAQDTHKTPVDPACVEAGLRGEAPPAGYNVHFRYPPAGMQAMVGAMAGRCDVRYGQRAVKVDPRRREVHFADGGIQRYGRLLATLPLDEMLTLTGVEIDEAPGPYTSLLALNVGAVRGARCPDVHWLYVPRSRAGFHRVGFYSHVDPSFLPRAAQNRLSLYIERAYPGNRLPSAAEIEAYAQAALAELRSWGFIGEAEVVSPSWVKTAYTWDMPGSRWREKGLSALEAHGIHMAGRYGRWRFQGIVESLREGFAAGRMLRSAVGA